MACEGLKRVEVFKTNVLEQEDADLLLVVLLKNFPHYKMNFDLEDCDRILRIEGHAVSNEQIISILSKQGYQCIALA